MSGRCVLRVAAREQPAFEVVRRGGELATRRGALGLNRNGRPLRTRCNSCFASVGSPRSCQSAPDSATAASAGHNRS